MSVDICRVTKFVGLLSRETVPTDAVLGYVYLFVVFSTSSPKYCLITAGRAMLRIAELFIGFSINTTKPESEFRGQHIKSSIIQAALSIKCMFCILNTTDNKEGLYCISDIALVDLVRLIIILVKY